jgi:L-Ala-D/L-Glu epimerase / N-acetyl-D-glutamate racemase
MGRTREIRAITEPWEFKAPFTITSRTFTRVDLLCVSITERGSTGRGEAAGVYYLNETGPSMLADVASVRGAIEAGADRQQLRALLSPGGARNAIDCALWDLEAKLRGTTIWALTGIEPGLTRSTMTISLGTPGEMAARANALASDRIKVKLDSHLPFERLAAVRAARPDAEILVDVNQGWTFEQLADLAPQFAELGVALIEQPLPRGADKALERYTSPVPLCADESCLGVSELEQAAQRYQVINIKLDKTGGLTEALELARRASAQGIELMVGSMMGTSLAMAPGFVVAQLCRYVDLDAPVFMKGDRDPAMAYSRGVVSAPRPELWG